MYPDMYLRGLYTACVSNVTRVVTGYDASGAPAIVWQGQPPVVIHAGRYTTTELWVSDRAPLAATSADAWWCLFPDRRDRAGRP
jgi:hypothetical protein